jgi:hypothetical protein
MSFITFADRTIIEGEEAIMNIQPNLHMDKTGFLAWMQANEERCELVGGRVVMMPRPSRAHGLIVSDGGHLRRYQDGLTDG